MRAPQAGAVSVSILLLQVHWAEAQCDNAATDCNICFEGSSFKADTCTTIVADLVTQYSLTTPLTRAECSKPVDPSEPCRGEMQSMFDYHAASCCVADMNTPTDTDKKSICYSAPVNICQVPTDFKPQDASAVVCVGVAQDKCAAGGVGFEWEPDDPTNEPNGPGKCKFSSASTVGQTLTDTPGPITTGTTVEKQCNRVEGTTSVTTEMTCEQWIQHALTPVLDDGVTTFPAEKCEEQVSNTCDPNSQATMAIYVGMVGPSCCSGGPTVCTVQIPNICMEESSWDESRPFQWTCDLGKDLCETQESNGLSFEWEVKNWEPDDDSEPNGPGKCEVRGMRQSDGSYRYGDDVCKDAGGQDPSPGVTCGMMVQYGIGSNGAKPNFADRCDDAPSGMAGVSGGMNVGPSANFYAGPAGCCSNALSKCAAASAPPDTGAGVVTLCMCGDNCQGLSDQTGLTSPLGTPQKGCKEYDVGKCSKTVNHCEDDAQGVNQALLPENMKADSDAMYVMGTVEGSGDQMQIVWTMYVDSECKGKVMGPFTQTCGTCTSHDDMMGSEDKFNFLCRSADTSGTTETGTTNTGTTETGTTETGTTETGTTNTGTTETGTTETGTTETGTTPPPTPGNTDATTPPPTTGTPTTADPTAADVDECQNFKFCNEACAAKAGDGPCVPKKLAKVLKIVRYFMVKKGTTPAKFKQKLMLALFWLKEAWVTVTEATERGRHSAVLQETKQFKTEVSVPTTTTDDGGTQVDVVAPDNAEQWITEQLDGLGDRPNLDVDQVNGGYTPPVSPTTTTGGTTSGNAGPSPSTEDDDGLGSGAIAGIVIGVAVALGIGGFVAMTVMKNKQQAAKFDQVAADHEAMAGANKPDM